MLIGKLADRTADSLSRRLTRLIRGAGRVETVTVDNGTEFHDYRSIEQRTGAAFYFARPYHSWERGSNENANGLVRQYLPKGASMAGLSQHQCNAIAGKLNTRPRKRLGYSAPLSHAPVEAGGAGRAGGGGGEPRRADAGGVGEP